MSARKPGFPYRAVMLLLLGSVSIAAYARDLDWREPWREPEDSAAAAAHGDEYAWRLFVALNWPADPATGVPDRRERLSSEQRVVWQAWLGAGEVYLEDGADPGPWSARRSQPPLERRFETVSRKERPNLRHIVGGVMVPVIDPVADARRLTEVRLNRTSFEYIRSRELYNEEGLRRALSSRRALSLPYGARQVKAKWRPIGESERGHYYTMQLTLADGTHRLYGLTAFHIASKDLPNWFWATFEHVDNPTLTDNDGWQLPSRDGFACGSDSPDCNRAPSGIGLEGSVWQYYRLRGTLTQYTDSQGRPQRLANSELEPGIQPSASCITCHARAAAAAVSGALEPLGLFDTRAETTADPLVRRGFVGRPDPAWFAPAGEGGGPRFATLDFVWSMMSARPKSSP